MSVVALVIAPSIAMDSENISDLNSSYDNLSIVDKTNYDEAITGLVSDNNKIEFTTNAKFIASGDELKSVYIFPNKNFLRNKCFSNNMILINGSENSSTSF